MFKMFNLIKTNKINYLIYILSIVNVYPLRLEVPLTQGWGHEGRPDIDFTR
jgi:hypothetical protein